MTFSAPEMDRQMNRVVRPALTSTHVILEDSGALRVLGKCALRAQWRP
jgi:hypothetical protein